MTKRYRIVYLLGFLAALSVVSFRITGSFAIPTGDKAIWFHSGLLLLVFGSYWVEAYFTKPADVVVNGLTTLIAVSLLVNPPYRALWDFIRLVSLILASVAFAIVWLGAPQSKSHGSLPLRFAYGIVVRVGSAKVLASAVFLVSVLSYFDLKSPEAKLLVLFWGAALLMKELELAELGEQLWKYVQGKRFAVLGAVTSFKHPNLVRFSLNEGATCRKDEAVAFVVGELGPDSPIGIATAHRVSAGVTEVEAAILDTPFSDGEIPRNRLALAVSLDDPMLKDRLATNSNVANRHRFIGYASKGTDISRIEIELTRRTNLEEGHLVSIQAGPASSEVLFQLVEGTLREEALESGSERSFTSATAEQIGTWNAARAGFETFSWVVPENSFVFHVLPSAKNEAKEQGVDIETVGAIPNSSFPVNVNIKELVLFHSAILGVTGSGKSFLAYQLLERLAREGVKVICLDVTGDYKRYLKGGVLLSENGDCKRFLDSTTSDRIGIVEFVDDKVHPITAANLIAKIAYEWCRDNRKEDEIKEPKPKVLIVLEEAHTLIPEWNYNPAKPLQDTVNSTSQIVLQARKFGLGFMVITQRTANVTKSILNQCNTIFAFQAYDETGFDFMKNYMGDRYVRALPNLKKRHGIIVGKASISDRPLIVRFMDQTRQLNLTVPAWKDVSAQQTAGAVKNASPAPTSPGKASESTQPSGESSEGPPAEKTAS